MKRHLSHARRLLLVAGLGLPLFISAQDSWVDQLLDTLGITSAPGQLRGAPGEGDLWVVELAGGVPVAWTSGGGLRTPIFGGVGSDLYALRGTTLVRVAGPGAAPIPLHEVPGVSKLVGADATTADRLLVLTADPQAPLASLSVQSGTLTPLPVDLNDPDQQRRLSQIRAQGRRVGSTSVLVQKQAGQTLAGPMEWTDIVVREGDGPTRNLSQCGGLDCSQPALSSDARRVVFVKTNAAD